MPGRDYDAFVVGERIEHGRRLTVTMEDNVAFCRLTLNNQPLHLDAEYAKTTPFGRVVVNGLLTFSACVGASVADTTEGTLVANLGYEEVQHPAPVYPGDQLRFETQVLSKRPSQKPDRGVVVLGHRVLNQDGVEVCRFRRIVLVKKGGGQ